MVVTAYNDLLEELFNRKRWDTFIPFVRDQKEWIVHLNVKMALSCTLSHRI